MKHSFLIVLYRWCKLEKWNRITNVMCLIIDDGIGVRDFLEQRDIKGDNNPISGIGAIFPNKLEFLSPLSYDSNLARDLSVVPVTKRRKEKLKELYGDMATVIKNGAAFHFYRSIFPVKVSGEHLRTVFSDLFHSQFYYIFISESSRAPEQSHIGCGRPGQSQTSASLVRNANDRGELPSAASRIPE